MSQSRHKITRRLTRAQQDQQPVTVLRKHLDQNRTSGFVVAVTDNWVVLQDLEDAVYLDALVFLRLDHVTKVTLHDNDVYVSRAVAGLGVLLADFTCPRGATTGDLLRLADQRASLVCIYIETRRDYDLLIGEVIRIGPKRLDLHFIGRDGVWTDFIDSWKLTDISRIEIGGRYIETLEKFGDPRPAVTKVVRR